MNDVIYFQTQKSLEAIKKVYPSVLCDLQRKESFSFFLDMQTYCRLKPAMQFLHREHFVFFNPLETDNLTGFVLVSATPLYKIHCFISAS